MWKPEALLDVARRAQAHAYAPYSRFPVGAALATAEGAVFGGSNVENAAYPAGTCAEQAAIGAMVTAGYRRIAALLVVGPGAAPITPCGACRQRIGEFADASTLIYLAGAAGIAAQYPFETLLPHAFGLPAGDPPAAREDP